MDITQERDNTASLMRDFLWPLRWWQYRRTWESCIADDLMLGLFIDCQENKC
jgi:hypothetical protein